MIEQAVVEFTKEKSEEYKKYIIYFLDYIKEVDVRLNEVNTGTVTDSIYHIVNRGYVYELEEIKLYAKSVYLFFKFLITKGYILKKDFKRQLLMPEIDDRSYFKRVNRAIAKNSGVFMKGSYSQFDKKDFQKLITICDKILSTRESYCEPKKYYRNLLCAISVKLIGLTGIKYYVLRNIKFHRKLAKKGIIEINGFRIELPANTKRQLNYYITVRDQLMKLNEKESEYLFVSYNCRQLPGNSRLLAIYLGTNTGRFDITGLMKYAIREMIILGINDSLIKRLTGAGKDLMYQCLNEVYSMQNRNNWNKQLNLGLQKLDAFKWF